MKKSKTLPPEQRYRSRGGKFFPALCNVLGTLMILAVIVTSLPLTVPRYLGYEIYNVVSGSMAPEIPVGSVIYVESVVPEEVQERDVIAFQSGESVITHRVMENRFVVGEFVTKGDANAGEDFDTVPYDALIGRVAYHFPVVGGLMALYASTVGKIYVLAFAACGVMFNLLAGRIRDRQREKLRRKIEADMRGGAAPENRTEAAGQSPRRRRGRGRRVLMAILLVVFIGSAAGAAAIQRQYKEGDALYEDIASRFMIPGAAEAAKPAAGPAAASRPSSAAAREEAEEAPVILADPAPIQVDFASLQAENSDAIGWLYCEGTVINYPVMQAADDDYYLHRDFDGAYSVFGSIFAEAENRPGFQDANTIVYGHHMRNGSMFASLENWADQSYYEAHPVMWLLTPEQDYQVVLLSGYTTSATSDTYTIFTDPGEDLDAYLAAALARSDFQTMGEPMENGRYVVLSTCAYVFDNARYVLHGLLVPAASAGGVPFGA